MHAARTCARARPPNPYNQLCSRLDRRTGSAIGGGRVDELVMVMVVMPVTLCWRVADDADSAEIPIAYLWVRR